MPAEKRPTRKCCNIMPNVISYWKSDGTKVYELECPDCQRITAEVALTEEEAIEMWDRGEVF